MSLRSLVWIPSWMSCSYFHNHDFCWCSCALVWSLSFLTALRCSFWAFNSSALPCISSKAVVHCCAFSASEIRTKKASIPFFVAAAKSMQRLRCCHFLGWVDASSWSAKDPSESEGAAEVDQEGTADSSDSSNLSTSSDSCSVKAINPGLGSLSAYFWLIHENVTSDNQNVGVLLPGLDNGDWQSEVLVGVEDQQLNKQATAALPLEK